MRRLKRFGLIFTHIFERYVFALGFILEETELEKARKWES